MTILLCGALSRRVNDLTDDPSPATGPTKALLSALRANLKIAVSSGLSDSAHDHNSTSLLASYLQILVMSDPAWLRAASHKVALAARGGRAGRPVAEAEGLVDKWVKRELKEKQLAAVEAYVGNAVGDLVLVGLWSVVTDSVQGGELESWFFARDDRMAKSVARGVGADYRTLYSLLITHLLELQGAGRAPDGAETGRAVQQALATRPRPARDSPRDPVAAPHHRQGTGRAAQGQAGRLMLSAM